MAIIHSMPVKMRNVSDKAVDEMKHTFYVP
jgi:hypothetical protein